LGRILLNPNGKFSRALIDHYKVAIREAEELYIASAYLTEWGIAQKPSSSCKQIIFLVGTDFGLTRKAALHAVLRRLPLRLRPGFLAVPQRFTGGFHPKLVAWRTRAGRHFCIIGSSNLSKAGFENNYEANVVTPIAPSDFRRIADWLDTVVNTSSPVTPDWIENHYQEARLRPQRNEAISIAGAKMALPSGPKCKDEVLDRRKTRSAFKRIEPRLRRAIERCSRGRMSNASFWELWGNDDSRFQGSGLQLTGKWADWRKACGALSRILERSRSVSGLELDRVVSDEIDGLANSGNAARGAWLTEMLCHFFPRRYPVRNGPVRKWLSSCRWRPRRGSTEGGRYIQLSRLLRNVVEQHPDARDLAELDAAIWRWVHDQASS
jgi:hypothetical protein